MSTCVCVLSNSGERLMPTFRLGKVRRLLKDGKAKIVKHHHETGWYEPEILGSGGSYRGVTKTSSEEEALQQLQKHTVNYAQRITVYKKDGKTVKREVAEYDQWEKKWMS